MERHEPTLGPAPDLANLEFRRSVAPPRVAPPKPAMDLSWKIAIGVFVGLSLFGLATCTGMAIIGAAVQAEQERHAEEVMAEFRRATSDPDPFSWRAAAQQQQREQARQEAARYALRPGERCIQGKRFRRVENGWIQVSRPCR
jgi:hypothetical protein